MDIRAIMQRFSLGPRDLVGIDLGTSATKAVRVRRTKDGFALVGAQLLPPLAGLPNVQNEAGPISEITLDGNTRARSAALAVTAQTAIIKLVSFPGPPTDNLAQRLPQDMGIKNSNDYRISYQILVEGRGRSESRIIAVAIPEAEASATMSHFSTGYPAPYSLEISSLASITAFQYACADALEKEPVGFIEFGDQITTLCILNKGLPVLLRRFEFGSHSLIMRVSKNLGVTEAISRSIISDPAFDISEIMGDLLDKIIAQVVVSRDFIERRENCHLTAIYATGGLMKGAYAKQLLAERLDNEIREWNPFDALTPAPDGAQPIEPDSAWRFAGAVGAALGTMEES